jgi:thiol-disulfide isomerase/thioredoxin
MILVRVATAMPQLRQEARLGELSGERIPEPARSMAKDALRTLRRLGRPLDLKFTALDGRSVDLTFLKGKVVLIDFWSTTCVPCVREMPDLKALYSKYRTQGFEVIGVTLDENKEVLQRFIQKEQLPWPQYFDAKGSQNPIAQEFNIRSIPVVWLVDRQGVLRDLNGREGQEKKIEALLKQH